MRKKLVVVDYRLFAFSKGYHAHRCLDAVPSYVYKILKDNEIVPDEIIFAIDKGETFRRQLYPLYKAHRGDKRKQQGEEEINRFAYFEEEYLLSLDYLKHFGHVLHIPLLEADDVASVIASYYAFKDDKYDVILLSSDSDWAGFLYNEHVTYLNLAKNTFFTHEDIEFVFDSDPLHMHLKQVFIGSAKENVKGYTNFGTKTYNKVVQKIKKPFSPCYTVECFRSTFESTMAVVKSEFYEYVEKHEKIFFDDTIDIMYDNKKVTTLETNGNQINIIECNTNLFSPILYDVLKKDWQTYLVKKQKPIESLSTMYLHIGFSHIFSEEEKKFYKVF